MEKTWYNLVIMSLFLVTGVLLNMIVFLLTLLTPSLRTINNEFICHTSAVSLTGCAVLFSISLVEISSHSESMTSSTENLCRAEQIVGVLCFSTSSVLIFFFGLYRFMSAVRPLTTLVHVRLNTLRIILLVPWVIAGFVSFLLNIDLTRECQFKDWTNISKSVFIGFFCVLVAVPVVSLSAFFLAIFLKTRQNKRKEAEVQVYHEQAIIKSVTSSQSQGGTVLRNPAFDNNLTSNKWDGLTDLTQLSLNSNNQLAGLQKKPDGSSISSDSIFDKLDKTDEGSDHDSFTASEGEVIDNGNDDETDRSKNGSSSSSDTESNSDLELDFILPQSEDFMQDMMAALHKSFRQSKHSIVSRTSIESINFEGSVSSINRLPSQPTESTGKTLTKMLMRSKSGSGSQGDSENKTFDVYDSEGSLPATPTFHPPPPPFKSNNSARTSSTTPRGDVYTRPTSHQLSMRSKKSTTSSVPFPVEPPPLPASSPPGDTPPGVRPPPLPSQLPPGEVPSPRGHPPPLPSLPPPDNTPPSCPPPGSSRDHSSTSSPFTDSFQATESEGRAPKSGLEQPIDKWLLERISTIERTKVEPINPSTGAPRENGSTEAVLGNTSQNTRSTGESFSEGYSTNVLLLIYSVLFLVFQVQHAIVTLHNILTPPPFLLVRPVVAVPLHRTISYTLHLVYYTLTPVVTLSICKPLKTVLYNRAVQIGVVCVDSVDWFKGVLSVDRDISTTT